MGILGNVENGWFAKLAHACQAISQKTLNFVSCGGHLGDKLYANMEAGASNYIATINQQAIDQALASGASQHAALSAGTAVLDRIADPRTVGQLADLAAHGTGVIGATVQSAVTVPPPPPIDVMGILTPILVGAGILGGAYLLVDACCGAPAMPSVKRVRDHMV